MSGHVSDRWHLKRKPRRGEETCTCRPRRVPTAKHGKGQRWQVEYRDPAEQMRYPCFDTEGEATAFLAQVQADMIRGTYRDPGAAKMTLRQYAETVFLPAQASDTATRTQVETVFRVHILPVLGARRLQELEAHPSLVQAWVNALPLAPSSAGRVFGNLGTVMRWAVRDGLISRNPCQAGITLPKQTRRRVDPWTSQTIATVRAALPSRWQAITDAGTGAGCRQGELFALAVEEIDFLRHVVHVRWQVKIVGARLVFAAPKSKAERSVPVAGWTTEALAAHLAAYPAAAVTLPVHAPGTREYGKPHTARLLFTTGDGRALNRNTFNATWRAAVKSAGLPAARVNACLQLRHIFASTLIAGGCDVRTVAEYMGHTDGGALLLRTYSHAMPGAEDRARLILATLPGSLPVARDTGSI